MMTHTIVKETTPLFMFPTNRMDIPQFLIVNKLMDDGVMADSISLQAHHQKLKDAITEGKIVPVAFEKCPLCLENRSFLLCFSCVNSGSFTHTQRRDGAKFYHLRREWKSNILQRDDNNRRFERQIDDIERANAKRTKVENLKSRILVLKRSIAETCSKCKTEKYKLRDDKLKRRQRRAFLDQNCHQAMVRLMHSIHDLQHLTPHHFVLQARLEGTSIDPKTIKDLKTNYDRVHRDLCRRRSAFIKNLQKHIFSVEEVPAISDNDNLAMSMATALKDACETAFIGGRWVHTDHRGENHYQIVSSTLPDYGGESCAMYLFAMANSHGSDKPAEIPVGKSSYGIQASLGYTAMFANLLSMTLDIPLPRKCSFRELCDDLNEHDFCNFVWRLHENLMHLASSQSVLPDELLDHLSLHNVLAILQSDSLGSDGPFVPDYSLPCTAVLCSLEYNCDTDTSMTDMDLSRDWERVPVGIPSVEVASLPLGVSAPVDNNTSTAGALISNAAASLAGWWRSYYN